MKVLLCLGLLLMLAVGGVQAAPDRPRVPERVGPAPAELGQRGRPAPDPQEGAGRAALPDRYVIVLREESGEAPQVASDMAQRHGLSVSHVYRHALRGFAAQIPPDRLAALQSDPRVKFVAEDRPIQAFAQEASTGLQRMGASTDGVHQTATHKGTGVGVAVLDSGIDLTHPDLVPVQNARSCISGTSSANDDRGHGTHVAGIIAARDNDIGVVGVAPEASLYAIKVLDSAGSGSESTLLCGVDWVTANAGPVGTPGKVQVANLSLGGRGTATPSNADCTNSNNDALHLAICQSVRAGVTYIVAAGNSGADASGFLPAAYEEVITVSALADADGRPGGEGWFTCTFDFDDTLGSFSNYGAPVDIAAPGTCIRSTWPGGGYALNSGTSMAAPHAAGAAALYKQANPGATPAQVKAALLAVQEPGPIPNDPDPFPEGILHVSSPTTLPARLNAGGSTYTDGQGQLWRADAHYAGGFSYSTESSIAGTTDDTLYQSERYGDFGYSFDLPNGTYTVTLKFAEIYFTSPATGQRVFDVAIEGQPVLSSFDILAEVPPFTALDRSFVVNVADGTLNVGFTTVVGNAKVSAVQVQAGAVATPTPVASPTPLATATATRTPTAAVTSTPTPTSTPTSTATATSTATSTAVPTAAVPIRINAGNGAYTDSQGRVWAADDGASGGGTYGIGAGIAGTADPTLYQTGRYGNFSYQFPLPSGTYTLTLKFAEPNRNGPGRVFHVDVEGQRVLSSFDVFQEGGYQAAVDRSFVVTVADGTLDVVFTTVSDAAIVSALEVLAGAQAPTPTPAVPLRLNAGGPAHTDSAGQRWDADRRYSGGSTYGISAGIAGTADPTLYQTGRYGNFSYQLPLPAGTYTLTLKFAEPNRNGPGRVFHVDVEGQRVLSSYDVWAEVGIARAVDKAFVVQVSDGTLDVVFTSVSDYAIVSALQVVAGSQSGSSASAPRTATPTPAPTATPCTPPNSARCRP